VQQITSWVSKVGPLYSLDSGSAVGGSLDMLEDNHVELEHRLKEAASFKDKAVEFIASLRTTGGQDGGQEVTQGHLEDESCLMQPLLELQCQMYQLRELIAIRAANTVFTCFQLGQFSLAVPSLVGAASVVKALISYLWSTRSVNWCPAES